MAKPIYVSRDIEQTLLRSVSQFPSIAILGPRQSGKSTLLKHLFSKTHSYASLDDPLTREKALSDPKTFLGSLGKKAIIDEIQYVPELTTYIKIAIDEHRDRKGSFLLTGSQQFSMIKNLGDSLAGRVALFDLFPFSFQEKSRAHLIRDAVSAKDGFVHACVRGCYPEIAVGPKIDRERWYGSYMSSYLERDVRGVYDIGNLRDFQRFIQILAARTAQVLNLSSLANDLGITVNTVKRWLSVLEASKIVFILQPYFESFGKRITKSPKVYFMDCGFVCYLMGIGDESQLMRGPMAGALFETYCLQETVKALTNQGRRADIYYLRTNNGLEIDLILRANGGKIYPFEIKMTRTPRLSMIASFQKYKHLFPSLQIMPGRIIYLGKETAPLTSEASMVAFRDYLDLISNPKNLD